METKEPMAYIATKDCGCMVAAMLVNAIEKKVLGKLVAEWVAAGYNIEFVTHSYVLTNWDLCRHGHKQAQLTEAAARAAEEAVKKAADQNGQAKLDIMSYSVSEDGTVGDLVTGDATAETAGDLPYQITTQLQEGILFIVNGNRQDEEYRAFADWRNDEEGTFVYTINKGRGDSLMPPEDIHNNENDANAMIIAMENIAPLNEWKAESSGEPSVALSFDVLSEDDEDDTDLPDENGVTEKLYARAKRVAAEDGTFSTTSLQKRLRVRWDIAARLVDRMRSEMLAVPTQVQEAE